MSSRRKENLQSPLSPSSSFNGRRGKLYSSWSRECRRNGAFCDVEIFASPHSPDEPPVLAHKIILVTSSKYFQEQLLSPSSEAGNNLVKNNNKTRLYIDGITRNALEILIEYIYAKDLKYVADKIKTMSSINLADLHEAAKILKLDKVAAQCQTQLLFVYSPICVENCINMISYSHQVGSQNRLEESVKFFHQNLSLVLKTCKEELCNLTYEIIKLVVDKGQEDKDTSSSSSPIIIKENLILCIATWLKHDAEGRKVYLFDLLKSFPLTHYHEIIYKIFMQDMDQECRQIFFAPITKYLMSSITTTNVKERSSFSPPLPTSSSSAAASKTGTLLDSLIDTLKNNGKVSTFIQNPDDGGGGEGATSETNRNSRSISTSTKSRTRNRKSSGPVTSSSASSTSSSSSSSSSSSKNSSGHSFVPEPSMDDRDRRDRAHRSNKHSPRSPISPNHSPPMTPPPIRSKKARRGDRSKDDDNYVHSVSSTTVNESSLITRQLSSSSSTMKKEYKVHDFTGLIYFIGNLPHQKQKLYVYNLNNNKYNVLASIDSDWPVKNTLVYHRNSIFLLGGRTQHTNLSFNDVRVFSLSKKRWRTQATIPQMRRERVDFPAVVVNGDLYAVGGSWKETGRGDRQTMAVHVERLRFDQSDPEDGPRRWSKIVPLTGIQRRYCVAALQGKMYVAGGGINGMRTFFDATSQVQCYDPEAETWTKVEPMLQARAAACLVATSKYLYAIGGYGRDGGGSVTSVEIYCPKRKKWMRGPPILKRRQYASGVYWKAENAIYVFGGDLYKRFNSKGPTIERLKLSNMTWDIVGYLKPEGHYWSMAFQ